MSTTVNQQSKCFLYVQRALHGYVVDVDVVVLIAAAVSDRGAGSSTSIATSSFLTDRAAASHREGSAKGRSASAAADVELATAGSALDGFDAGVGASAAPFDDANASCSPACAAAGVSLADAVAKGSAACALASAGEVLDESCAGDPFAPPPAPP